MPLPKRKTLGKKPEKRVANSLYPEKSFQSVKITVKEKMISKLKILSMIRVYRDQQNWTAEKEKVNFDLKKRLAKLCCSILKKT